MDSYEISELIEMIIIDYNNLLTERYQLKKDLDRVKGECLNLRIERGSDWYKYIEVLAEKALLSTELRRQHRRIEQLEEQVRENRNGTSSERKVDDLEFLLKIQEENFASFKDTMNETKKNIIERLQKVEGTGLLRSDRGETSAVSRTTSMMNLEIQDEIKTETLQKVEEIKINRKVDDSSTSSEVEMTESELLVQIEDESISETLHTVEEIEMATKVSSSTSDGGETLAASGATTAVDLEVPAFALDVDDSSTSSEVDMTESELLVQIEDESISETLHTVEEIEMATKVSSSTSDGGETLAASGATTAVDLEVPAFALDVDDSSTSSEVDMTESELLLQIEDESMDETLHTVEEIEMATKVFSSTSDGGETLAASGATTAVDLEVPAFALDVDDSSTSSEVDMTESELLLQIEDESMDETLEEIEMGRKVSTSDEGETLAGTAVDLEARATATATGTVVAKRSLCTICQIDYAHRASLYRHRTKKHPDKVKKIKRNASLELDRIARNTRRKPTGVKKPFKCPICGYDYFSGSALSRHKRSNHPDMVRKKKRTETAGLQHKEK